MRIEFLDSDTSGPKDLVNITKLPGYPIIRLRDSLTRTRFDENVVEFVHILVP